MAISLPTLTPMTSHYHFWNWRFLKLFRKFCQHFRHVKNFWPPPKISVVNLKDWIWTACSYSIFSYLALNWSGFSRFLEVLEPWKGLESEISPKLVPVKIRSKTAKNFESALTLCPLTFRGRDLSQSREENFLFMIWIVTITFLSAFNPQTPLAIWQFSRSHDRKLYLPLYRPK